MASSMVIKSLSRVFYLPCAGCRSYPVPDSSWKSQCGTITDQVRDGRNAMAEAGNKNAFSP